MRQSQVISQLDIDLLDDDDSKHSSKRSEHPSKSDQSEKASQHSTKMEKSIALSKKDDGVADYDVADNSALFTYIENNYNE